MADYPLDELSGQTPLEAAKTPHMDRIAACRIGRVQTIPAGFEPGSDVANLSLLGYDPSLYHTGRAPLEAASMGINLKADQVAFRMNLVTLDHKDENNIFMRSHSAGDISTEEARQLIDTLKKEMKIPDAKIYPGIAYRHLLIWDQGPIHSKTIPPHDVLDQNIAPYLCQSDQITAQIRKSWAILKEHPINYARCAQGKKEANSIWLWGQGTPPQLPSFEIRFGLTGGMISAVDLLKGLGIYAGLEAPYVEGATGYLDTNYSGKVKKAIEVLKTHDFIFVHVEAPDEAGHNGNLNEKIQAIEYFDEKVVGSLIESIDCFADYRIMVASDHYTPISKRTHTMEPAPFAWATKAELASNIRGQEFTEKSSEKSDLFYNKGHDLIPAFLSKS